MPTFGASHVVDHFAGIAQGEALVKLLVPEEIGVERIDEGELEDAMVAAVSLDVGAPAGELGSFGRSDRLKCEERWKAVVGRKLVGG